MAAAFFKISIKNNQINSKTIQLDFQYKLSEIQMINND